MLEAVRVYTSSNLLYICIRITTSINRTVLYMYASIKKLLHIGNETNDEGNGKRTLIALWPGSALFANSEFTSTVTKNMSE